MKILASDASHIFETAGSRRAEAVEGFGVSENRQNIPHFYQFYLQREYDYS